MWSLNTIDYAVILGYLGALVVLGLALERMASKSLDDYFIGGRRLPWWALGVSGMAYFLDMTGTMVITSFLFLLGPRGLFIEFRGGAVLVLAFMMLWAGKWHRRSKCLTGAEWMVFRFGDGLGGRFAQAVSAMAGIVSSVGMLAYLIKGAGLFLTMFFPYSPLTCTLIMIGITTIYTMISGFYGVVFTDLFQSAIIVIGVIIVTAMAMVRIAGVEDFGALAVQVTGNADWMSTLPQWKTTMPAGYEQYEALVMFAFFYLMKNIFLGVTSGADSRYFGARSDRECGLLSLFWTTLMTVRWPMMMAFAVMGIFLVHDLFPDPAVMTETSELIKANVAGIDKAQWADTISNITNHPEQFSPALVEGLQQLLGEQGWMQKLMLVGYEGHVDPERILPAVLLFNIPPGLRGLLLVVLLAAAMSTFNATVNLTTGFITRDIYQKYIHRRASTRELIYISWAGVCLIVVVSFVFAFSIKSINDIWGWIIMGLGGGLLIPGVLRLLWWRFNGGGFAAGTFVGLMAAILQRYYYPGLDERLQFLLLGAIGLVASIAGTYLTRPEDDAVVARFYRITRPFGIWGPYRNRLSAEDQAALKFEHSHDILASPFALLWQVCMFILPMQAVIGAWKAFYPTLAVCIVCALCMYFIWFRHLPENNYFEPGEEAGVKMGHETE
ncbi:MAG TPA: sodium:solute symporter [Candidatus Hydrogenedentes bacterium]|nr:MAG: Sodium/glucose cotransporter [Candidatus Hydrogenedentes bacterium ADurb.Bin179]HOH29002.1 sodium:solute symporter [Candidatus Hydrogenedentota bacterium]